MQVRPRAGHKTGDGRWPDKAWSGQAPLTGTGHISDLTFGLQARLLCPLRVSHREHSPLLLPAVSA